MSSSLSTALSGLRAHQQWIDVVGNNLSNSSTPGFKSSYVSFSESYARTLAFATAPGGSFGGTNPQQIGLGSRLASIGRNFNQGVLQSTGRTFDVAIQGAGFFTMQTGSRTVYTRVGAFTVDASKQLVDERTGYRVLDRNGASITLDSDERLAPRGTSELGFVGNLPKQVTGPLPKILASTTALTDGDPARVAGSTAGPFTIPAGETWSLGVRINGGAPRTVSITSVTGTVTTAEVVAQIDALDDVRAYDDGAGNVVVETDQTGETATLKLDPGPAGRDLTGLIGVSTALVRGSETDVSTGTALNDLPANVVDYADGDSIRISGVDADGAAVSASFVFGAANDGTTVGELMSFIEGIYPNATVSLDEDGHIHVQADTAGESGLSVTITDASTATGRTTWSVYALSTEQNGTGPDVVTTSMQVYDAAGVSHPLQFTFERQPDLTWTLTTTMDSSEGTVLSTPVSGISFGDNGSPAGFGALSTEILVQFQGQTGAQSVNLDLGGDGSFAGLTQLGGEADAHVVSQNGYAAGQLGSFSISRDGSISGFYTNGEVRELAQLGITTFTNAEGLEMIGDNLFVESGNSGEPSIGAGGTGRAGAVFGGSLEGSNVDTAEEFVRLIQAQRGFQANARVITAQDEVLRETVNLI